MRRASKVDVNQTEVVKAFRNLGFSVLHLHQVGNGCPDLAIGKHGKTWLCEIKQSSKHKLTQDEEQFWRDWLGSLILITSIDEVIEFNRKHFTGLLRQP